MRGLRLLALAAMLACLLPAGGATAAEPGIAEFPLGEQREATAIVGGPGGNLWFVANDGSVGRISPTGQVEEFPPPRHYSEPRDIAAGADGNLWVTTLHGVNRVTPSGGVTEFRFPRRDEEPGQIVAGPDGDLWFTLTLRQRANGAGHPPVPAASAWIVRITTSGEMTKLPLSGPARGEEFVRGGITTTSDGSVWFTDPSTRRIGRIDPRGRVEETRLADSPYGIAADPDGGIWFASHRSIGRVSPSGELSEFHGAPSVARQMTVGPDGNLWFTTSSREIGRMTPWGQVSWFRQEVVGDYTVDVATGPDGNVWFTTFQTKSGGGSPSIGRITPGLPGIDVLSVTRTPRDRRVEVELACVGATGAECRGMVRLEACWFCRNNEPKLPVVKRPYALPVESRATVSLTLPARTLRLLDRDRYWRTGVRATLEGGGDSLAEVVLARRDPLRGAPRPGRQLQIQLPRGYLGATSIAKGPDGGMWLTEREGDRIARISSRGVVEAFRLPRPRRQPDSIVAGPDGAMWFTEAEARIGRITVKGRISDIRLPGRGPARDVAVGPDGNLWVARRSSSTTGRIDRVSPGGRVREFPVAGSPIAIATGPDGSLWFTESGPNAIGRITPRGKVTRFWVRSRGWLGDIALGPDHNLWFPRFSADDPAIGRITPRGRIVQFPTSQERNQRYGPDNGPTSIVAGPEGNLFFTEALDRVSRITPRGRIRRYPVVRHPSRPAGIAVGPEGNLWTANRESSAVGVLAPERAP